MATIYAIECEKTGFAYVGCTKGSLGKRMREHRCLLNAGSHKSSGMVADWRQHGPDSFRIKCLEVVGDDLDARRTAELVWMERYDGRLYNAERISYRPPEEGRLRGVEASRFSPNKRNRWTPEANLKRRLAQLGKPKNHGHKISATKRLRAASQ